MDLTHYPEPYIVNYKNAANAANVSADRFTYFQDQFSTIAGEYVYRVKKT